MPPIHPAIAALHQMHQQLMTEGEEPDHEDEESEEEEEERSPYEDARNQDKSGCLYISKNIFEGRVSKGDTVMVKGKVVSMGDKIGIEPEEVTRHSDEHDGHEDGEEDEEHEYEEEHDGGEAVHD